jgi:copper chaperone CopZ
MEVGDLAGVSIVDASAESKTATIEFDVPASEDAIKALLAEINYPAK